MTSAKVVLEWRQLSTHARLGRSLLGLEHGQSPECRARLTLRHIRTNVPSSLLFELMQTHGRWSLAEGGHLRAAMVGLGRVRSLISGVEGQFALFLGLDYMFGRGVVDVEPIGRLLNGHLVKVDHRNELCPFLRFDGVVASFDSAGGLCELCPLSEGGLSCFDFNLSEGRRNFATSQLLADVARALVNVLLGLWHLVFGLR